MTGIDDDAREMTADSIEKELNEAEQRLCQKQADLEAIHKQLKSHPEVEGQIRPPPSVSIPGVLNDQRMRLGRLQQLDAANEPTRTHEESAAGCWSWKLQPTMAGISHTHRRMTAAAGCCNEPTRT